MKRPEFQKDLSLQSPILLDPEYKRAKVEKMLSILEDCGAVSKTKKQLAVDIGCSRGFFCSALAPYFDAVIGVDIDRHALEIGQGESLQQTVHYVLGDSLKLPLPDGSVDLVICNHVYEHVPDATRLFAEIYRVLSDTGVCYLGAASRLTLVEPHYHLPFLSWLPKPVANIYMRITGKGEKYYENLRTLRGINRLISKFSVQDYTLKIAEDPDKFRARDVFPRGGLLERVPLRFWRCLYWVLPSYVFVLRRRSD
jgi:SAM-dependent methyltransferase